MDLTRVLRAGAHVTFRVLGLISGLICAYGASYALGSAAVTVNAILVAGFILSLGAVATCSLLAWRPFAGWWAPVVSASLFTAAWRPVSVAALLWVGLLIAALMFAVPAAARDIRWILVDMRSR